MTNGSGRAIIAFTEEAVIAGFAASLRVNSAKVLLQVNNNCYRIAKELFTLTVNLTPSPANPGPFAKGVLSNQWYPGQGSDFSTEIGTEMSDNGAGSLSRIAMLGGLQFDGKDGALTLTNNVEYGYLAEVKGWDQPRWSGVPPYRMVARSIQAISVKYK